MKKEEIDNCIVVLNNFKKILEEDMKDEEGMENGVEDFIEDIKEDIEKFDDVIRIISFWKG